MLSSPHLRDSPAAKELEETLPDKLASHVPIPHTPRAGFHLHKHIFRRRSRSTLEKIEDPLALTSHSESVLFLRVFAAAEYVTADHTLMEEVPPVLVDIILDEYIFNILPRSLIPTIVWMGIVGFMAWWLGGWVVQGMLGFVISAGSSDGATKKREQKEKHYAPYRAPGASQANPMNISERKKDR
jgi:hypothetical protein